MYVPNASACTERNSQTPMDPNAIAAQDARVSRVGARFVRGNIFLDNLVKTLGGMGIGDVAGVTALDGAADFRNAPSCDTAVLSDGSLYGGRVGGAGDLTSEPSMGGSIVSGGVVTPGVNAPAAAAASAAVASSPVVAGSWVAAPGSPALAPVPPASSPILGWWDWFTKGRGSSTPKVRAVPPAGCVFPRVMPMVTVFPIPAAGPAVPSPAAVASSAPSPAPAASVSIPPTTPRRHARRAPVPTMQAPSSGAPSFPTTGNTCLDLSLTYVLQSQLSPAMIQQCASKGYGNLLGIKTGPLLTSDMIAWRNAHFNELPKVPDSTVPAATDAMAKQYGFAGVGDSPTVSPAFVIAGLGLGAVALWWAMDSMKKGRR